MAATVSLPFGGAASTFPSRKARKFTAKMAMERFSTQSLSSTEVGIVVNGVEKRVEGDGVVKGAVSGEERRRENLRALYEDGFGQASVKDYLEWARDIIKPDGGGPRWFCPLECGAPLEGSPLLLFLPGADGVGLGLILHHRSLERFSRVFEVRCLHLPVYDRTPYEGLLKFVEDTVRMEHASSPSRPIFIVGDSFGGCLALSVAARNLTIDLSLVLCNPATSFGRSQLQPVIPVLESIPNELHFAVPYLLSFIMGDPVKLAMANLPRGLSPSETVDQLSNSLVSMLPGLSDLSDILPKETLSWKLKLLQDGAAYTNSRLHAVRADVLLLCSGKDYMLPSAEEAARLRSSLKSCKVRYFKDNGHTLLLEDGINLLTIIKGTNMYRRSRKHDSVSDFLPPSMSEFKAAFDNEKWFNVATSPVFFSTLENGDIVRGISGVPDEGPVLLVGYHMLMGLELSPLYEEFLREKKVAVFGALRVSPLSMYRLFSEKSFVLLYPGGAREALHRKGEEYKLFWPDQPEFVRMAARFGVTIVPFGVIGEDDVTELVIDYDDLQNIPIVKGWIEEVNDGGTRVRDDTDGELNQDLHFPGLLPKIPGRFYYLFGKPIKMAGKEAILKDRENAKKLYLQTKAEVENIIAYLKRKREEDPYRSILQRAFYQAANGPREIPTFEN